MRFVHWESEHQEGIIMAYVCEMGTGRRLYLDNQNGQTIITISNTAPGQQQQASSSFQTGPWTATPEVYLTSDGAVVKLQTARGANYIRLQGNSIGVSEALSLNELQQMQMQQTTGFVPSSMPPMQPMPPIEPMKPMEPMRPMDSNQPMTMGDMQMNANPMEMRMGNMEMKMGQRHAAAPSSTEVTPATKRFCSQCGAAVKESDRFCTSCGHRLQD
jgi:hypothetical protein